MSRSDLHDLALRIRSTDPDDRAALLQHLEPLCEVSEFVREQDPRTCGAILLAAGHVIQALAADGDALDRRQGHAILCGLIQVVEKALATRATQRAQAAERLRLAQEAAERAVSAGPRSGAAAAAKAEPEPEVQAEHEPAPAPAPSYQVTRDMFLGEVLLGAGMIHTAELAAAMEIHRAEGIRLGEALIRIGCLTEDELEGGLFLQSKLRRVAQTRAPRG